MFDRCKYVFSFFWADPDEGQSKKRAETRPRGNAADYL
jgi:hypothetical protein